MGHPKKPKKKYLRPGKPWEKERIIRERDIINTYGYKNKKEIWGFTAMLRGFRAQARKIVALGNEQAKKEGENLLNRLIKMGLLDKKSTLDNVLELTINNISERRLLTLVMRQGLARTPKQARQFVTHRHIMVGGKVVTSPNYIVLKDEEKNIIFTSNSPFKSKHHPLIEQMNAAGKKNKKETVKSEEVVEEKVNKTDNSKKIVKENK